MRKITLSSIIVLIACLNLMGCSSKLSDLNQATAEVEKYNNGESVPSVQGLEIKEIDLLTDPLEQGRNSIIYSFTDKKGKLGKANSISTDTQILYGPYKGTDVFKLTVSKAEVIYEEDMNKKVINEIEMEYKTINDRIIISARSQGESYTYEAKINDEYTEKKHFDLFYEVISSRKVN